MVLHCASAREPVRLLFNTRSVHTRNRMEISSLLDKQAGQWVVIRNGDNGKTAMHRWNMISDLWIGPTHAVTAKKGASHQYYRGLTKGDRARAHYKKKDSQHRVPSMLAAEGHAVMQQFFGKRFCYWWFVIYSRTNGVVRVPLAGHFRGCQASRRWSAFPLHQRIWLSRCVNASNDRAATYSFLRRTIESSRFVQCIDFRLPRYTYASSMGFWRHCAAPLFARL